MCISGGVVRKNSIQTSATGRPLESQAMRAMAIGNAMTVPATTATAVNPIVQGNALKEDGEVANDGIKAKHGTNLL